MYSNLLGIFRHPSISNVFSRAQHQWTPPESTDSEVTDGIHRFHTTQICVMPRVDGCFSRKKTQILKIACNKAPKTVLLYIFWGAGDWLYKNNNERLLFVIHAFGGMMCVVAESCGGGASKALQIQLELPNGNGSIQREDMVCAFLYANYIYPNHFQLVGIS